ncbi:hypothetical protein BJ878DRAFT_542668 [Calycina marina]|uniref:Uncharacterized protein n=1 Tax=Calycina marina TaxID=1763456 RepID=A0A9P8CEE6_9HELO|nr:hypothetical protein BJ878DRAFT_542668 [Calycina marina]
MGVLLKAIHALSSTSEILTHTTGDIVHAPSVKRKTINIDKSKTTTTSLQDDLREFATTLKLPDDVAQHVPADPSSPPGPHRSSLTPILARAPVVQLPRTITTQHRAALRKHNATTTYNDMKYFSATFKLHTPIPDDILAMIAKAPSKKKEMPQNVGFNDDKENEQPEGEEALDDEVIVRIAADGKDRRSTLRRDWLAVSDGEYFKGR